MRHNVSDHKLREVTGRDWREWTAALAAAGAGDWSHKQIVAWLKDNTGLSGWWQQTIAVGFEKETGRRVVGETAGAGFQVGVRRTFGGDRNTVWKLLTSPAAKTLWLGTDAAELRAEARYRTETGIHGEIRVVRPADRIRFTRQEAKDSAPSTVQIALTAAGADRTAVIFHHEKLRDAAQREAMRRHWQTVAALLAAMPDIINAIPRPRD